MPPTFQIDFDLLAQARSVGGEIDETFDRQTQPGQNLALYTVVGRNSKDSSYRGEMNGRSVEISRAGEFRRKNGEGEVVYFADLPQIVVLDARTAYTIFKDNKVVARGISTKGLQNAAWTESDGCVIVGAACETSPYCRWVWERQGGKEGKVLDANGYVLAKEDLATCSLQLWCWDLTHDEHCIVQFSAGAIKAYREWGRTVETQGVKIHSILWRLTTEPVDNGATAAPSYVPCLDAVRVLTETEFARADEERAKLVVKTAALAPKKLDALPPALSNPPLINVGPAIKDPNDVFAEEQ